jgi:hypothetical protein
MPGAFVRNTFSGSARCDGAADPGGGRCGGGENVVRRQPQLTEQAALLSQHVESGHQLAP